MRPALSLELAFACALAVNALPAMAQVQPLGAPTSIPLRTPSVVLPQVTPAVPHGVPELQPVILQRPAVQSVPDFSRAASLRTLRGRKAVAVFGNRGEAAGMMPPHDRAARSAIAAKRRAHSVKLAQYRRRMALPQTRVVR